MIKTLTLKNLTPGTKFNAGPIIVRVLEHFEDDRTLLISDECIGKRYFTQIPFSTSDRTLKTYANDWRFSRLLDELNTIFLVEFGIYPDDIHSEDIVPVRWDLSDHKGGEGYGYSESKIGLLTEEMFNKYSEQGLLSLNSDWWLCTPTSKSKELARIIHSNGSVEDGYAYHSLCGVRPAFFVKSGTILSVEPEQVKSSTSALLAEFTSKQLVEEVLRRIAEGQEDGDDNEKDDF